MRADSRRLDGSGPDSNAERGVIPCPHVHPEGTTLGLRLSARQRASVPHFEADHPDLTALVQRVVDQVANPGEVGRTDCMKMMGDAVSKWARRRYSISKNPLDVVCVGGSPEKVDLISTY
jgi:hypothetical protein